MRDTIGRARVEAENEVWGKGVIFGVGDVVMRLAENELPQGEGSRQTS
jgi:hypothetical protein